ncbi:phage tail-collar fiber domain-containing protein [Acinetobacter sp.]|uniref:phage tail-collar fiber domain-containing protein n=1 Tax=Acinetobacter sp. TaxID=472 RepID=UPI002FCC2E47
MSDYFNVTTNVGDAAIATAIANNSKLNITHIAFGDGNGSVPTPTKTRTSLVKEVHRQAVTKYTMHPTVANYIVIETIISSNIGGFWIREMGIIADNVLISHGSHAPFFKVADPDGVSEYRLKFTQNVRDGNVVEILLDESLIYASQAWVNENYIRRNELVNNLTTDDANKPVSAKQAKDLQDNKLDKTANAVSANKLKNARKINTIDFDGTQDINIEAPLRWVGMVSTPDQLNSAALDGKYTVSELSVAGLYGYGILVVFRSGGVCHQIYYPHLGSSPNNATMAMRQTWNMNGDIASWSEWRVVGTRDDSKLPLDGGTLTGDLTVNGTSNFKSINATGEITIDKPEVVLKHKLSGRYLYINNGGWGVYSPQGSIPLPVSSGGTGNFEGRAPSADRLATPRNIFGQTFDGSGDVGGTVTAWTGIIASNLEHYIDFGRNGIDRINFAVPGAVFNFMNSSTGEIVARITPNGIDCNAASASKLKIPRNINGVNFDGTTDINLPLIGIGQAWKDLAALRVENTTYINSSNRTITIFFGGARQGVPATEFYVNGEIFAQFGGGYEPDEVYFSIPIPPNGSYKYVNKPQTYFSIKELS